MSSGTGNDAPLDKGNANSGYEVGVKASYTQAHWTDHNLPYICLWAFATRCVLRNYIKNRCHPVSIAVKISYLFDLNFIGALKSPKHSYISLINVLMSVTVALS